MEDSGPSRPAGSTVVVVGGGIAGLSTAIALRARGFDVAVYEKVQRLREIGAGVGVRSNAMRALERLGVADKVMATTSPIDRHQMLSWKGRLLADIPLFEMAAKRGVASIAVHRVALQAALLGALPPSILRLGATCTGFEEGEHAVTARFADGTEVEAALLVGADGIHSAVRTTLLGETPLRYAQWVSWRGVATFDHADLAPGVAYQSFGRGRQFGMWPIGGGNVYWVGSARMAEGQPDAPEGRKAELLARFGTAGFPPVRAIIEATDEEAILRNDIYDREPVSRWSSDRVILIGDAAHPTTPALGHGAGLAIEDADALGEHLSAPSTVADRESRRAALHRFESARVPRTTAVTKESWSLGRLQHSTNVLACLARDAVFRFTPDHTWLERMEPDDDG